MLRLALFGFVTNNFDSDFLSYTSDIFSQYLYVWTDQWTHMDKSFVSFKYSLQQTSCYCYRNLTQSDFLLILDWESNIWDNIPFLNLDNLMVDRDIEHKYADEWNQTWNSIF